MSSKTLCLIMRATVISVAISLLFLCGYLFPSWGIDIATANPEFAHWYWPWITLLWASSILCYCVLVYIWKVSGAVEREEVFTVKTAKWVKAGALLVFADVGLFFVCNLLFWLIGINHPGIMLLSVIVDLFAITLAVLAAVLSRYLTQAAVLQEESEGTI